MEWAIYNVVTITLNSEIFARVYIRETSHMRSFVKIKSSRNGEITLSFTDEGKLCQSRECLRRKYVFKTIHENKILAKISEFTINETIQQEYISIIFKAKDSYLNGT